MDDSMHNCVQLPVAIMPVDEIDDPSQRGSVILAIERAVAFCRLWAQAKAQPGLSSDARQLTGHQYVEPFPGKDLELEAGRTRVEDKESRDHLLELTRPAGFDH